MGSEMCIRDRVEGKHVVVLEDLVDSGLSMGAFLRHVVEGGALSVAVLTALNKPAARKHPLPNDVAVLSAFAVHKDLWATGFGMDIDGEWRDLKGIWAPRPQLEQVPENQRYSPTWR